MGKYLIDTNCISDYLSASLSQVGMQFMDEVINAVPNISIITQIQLLCWEYKGIQINCKCSMDILNVALTLKQSKMVCKALFYKIDGYIFRKYLDIKCDSLNSGTTNPDLIFICLNPGSCKSNDFDKEVDVLPDPTIRQLSKLIGYNGISFIRLLNLMDFREPKSKKLFDNPSVNYINEFSIFADSRTAERNILIPKNSKIILAWGVNPRNKKLAGKAIDVLNEMEVTILNKNPPFYHPLPRLEQKRIEWIKATKKLWDQAELLFKI